MIPRSVEAIPFGGHATRRSGADPPPGWPPPAVRDRAGADRALTRQNPLAAARKLPQIGPDPS
jgi:hypothetical protein